MPYQATVMPIMIASPGDVFDEREIVREVVHNWNYINSAKTKVILMPAGWETHTAPELGIRPQELINSRILKDCDILIGVFWTRLGTPTGKSDSGTVEEIEEHIKAGRPALIYFSSKPAAPETFDAKQYNSLLSFKEHCRKLGLVQEFDNIIEFKDKVSNHLQLCLYQNPYLQNILQEHAANIEELSPTAICAFNNEYRISEEAQILLKAAASNKDGIIIKISLMSGRFVQAGGLSFGGERGKESAKWEHALNELLNQNLVVAKGYKGEFFELTHEGWQLADGLKK